MPKIWAVWRGHRAAQALMLFIKNHGKGTPDRCSPEHEQSRVEDNLSFFILLFVLS